jgi:hypothetical protein
LKLRFEQHPSAAFLSEIVNKSILNDENAAYFIHNNFGICNQQRYLPYSEGLARVKAQILSPGHVLETQFAEIAVFDSLTTRSPHYHDFF